MLGIVSNTTALKWASLSGTRKHPVWEKISVDNLKIKADIDEGQFLVELRALIGTLWRENKIDSVYILKAVGGMQQGPAEIRVKSEGIVQMVGAEMGIPVRLVAPNSLRNEEKRFDIYAEGTPESVFTEGKKFKSKELRDAVLLAWMGLPSA